MSRINYLLSIFVALAFLGWGCIDDDPVEISQAQSSKPSQQANEDGDNSDESDDVVAVCPGIVEDDESDEDDGDEDAGVLDFGLTTLHLNDSHYAGWKDGNESYGPEEGTPMELDGAHSGYMEARCWDCHAEGTPLWPKEHDLKMQYWAWSCARGFPGTTCHGHGVNGCYGFNHANDQSFANCTTGDGCHTKFHEESYYENHAMDSAPDLFCNACHDYYWTGWPELEDE